MLYDPVEQDQHDISIHHAAYQSYNCTADSFEASEDQGKAFSFNPLIIDQYGNTGYELDDGISFAEKSQLFGQDPFGDCSSILSPIRLRMIEGYNSQSALSLPIILARAVLLR